jgi:hypothetical protein
LVIVCPQQQVGFAVPGHSGGAGLVTVTSQPQLVSGQRYTSPCLNAIINLLGGVAL